MYAGDRLICEKIRRLKRGVGMTDLDLWLYTNPELRVSGKSGTVGNILCTPYLILACVTHISFLTFARIRHIIQVIDAFMFSSARFSGGCCQINSTSATYLYIKSVFVVVSLFFFTICLRPKVFIRISFYFLLKTTKFNYIYVCEKAFKLCN